MISLYKLGSQPQKSPKIAQKRTTHSRFAQFLNRYGIYQVIPGESSCPEGNMCGKEGLRSIRPSFGRPKLTPISRFVTTKLRCQKNYITLFYFHPIILKRIEYGPQYGHSMFYLFPSNRTKNSKVLVFYDTS